MGRTSSDFVYFARDILGSTIIGDGATAAAAAVKLSVFIGAGCETTFSSTVTNDFLGLNSSTCADYELSIIGY